MPLPELLIANQFQNTMQVAELVGGTSITQIGADVLASGHFDSIDTDKKHVGARVIEYRGEIWTTTYETGPNLRIKGYDGSTWTTRHTNSGASRTIGMWIVNTGSAQRLVVVGTDQSANARVSYTDDGSSWTDFSVSLSGWSVTAAPTGKTILFNNKIYFLYGSGVTPYCVEVDPIAGSASNIPVQWSPGTVSSTDNGCFVVYDDRLFCFHAAATGNSHNLTLYEFTGGGWSANTNVALSNDSGRLRHGCGTMFTDPSTGDLIVITNGYDTAFQRGSRAFRLTPSGTTFTPSDITTTVIPSGLRPGVRGVSDDHMEDRWFVYVNTDTPGSTEVYFFAAAGPAPGTGYSVYQWAGVGAEMTLVGVGPSTTYGVPEAPFGGGDRISRGSGNQCEFVSGLKVPGGFQVSYRVWGLQPGQSVTLWYSLSQETPDQQASISAQTGGSGISGGNQVDGITGDDGATLFTLTWDALADAVPVPDSAHLFLDIN